MTIETCKLMIEQAKARGNDEEVAMLEKRIESKLRHPKNAHLREVKEEPKSKEKK